MELIDSGYRNLDSIVVSTDLLVGFKLIDVAILLGLSTNPKMKRSNMLLDNAEIYEAHGKALN